MNIELRDIHKAYDKTVLNNISLKLDGFNTVAIIGKSGCGKSTLLRLMTGIEEPDHGSITINGYNVETGSRREYHNNIGIVFQQHNLFPHLSLLRNISLILEKTRGLSSSDAEQRAIAQLTQLQLEDQIYKKPAFVSGGQAQRASIARALSTDPEIVFMDEPTAALDPILTNEVLEAVLNLKSSGTKFIFVTHELDFVRKFAEYIIFLDDGVIKEHGPVETLKNPATEKLEQFLLRPPLKAVI
ncbi:MAG: ATP-binding cassette domain-containing protein [Spirochaetales bacterium]|uniref:ATP-binding cassette domain-containing protein n=1 Tax=Candidatus Thalassospirochaeta sargassi TaxID=3119039 RepID=A0AAJ1IGN4_9SPIO|nr:ATP-binding cassette domain-containing protein [Spirochaetales bacterium]